MRNRLLSLSAALALSLGAVGSASAATATDNLNISVQSYAVCDFSVGSITMTGVHGLQDTAEAFLSGGVQVMCNPEVTYTVEPGAGQWFGFNPNHPDKRAAVGALNLGYFLPYTLHAGMQTTLPWGTGGDAIMGYSTGEWVRHDIAAKFYDFSKVPGDTYTDQVVITLTYF